ncbi:MAG TPA: MBL fold metallo-hydrolase [Candidatus Thermoplasmatota archaeon]|nr:MBL fold metallo-hydrolase [Candidatus Thermoplasmatota archaeon]
MISIASRVERIGDVERLVVARAVAGRALYWTSAYLVDGALIDSCHRHARAEVLRWLDGRAPEVALATHHHEDHAGNFAALACDVIAPRGDVARLASGERVPLYRAITWGHREPARARGGDDARAGASRFRAVATPGHTPDHVAWFDPDRGHAYVGDAVLGKRKMLMREEDVWGVVRSLEALRALDPDAILPAHGPVIDRPRATLEGHLAHFDRLARECRRLADRGLGIARIRARVLGPEGGLAWFSGGEISKTNLVRGLLTPRT